ncbi:MAG: TolC family protein [Desulfobulbaceae bacterium]|nr:TolC family protein [Desulfobulbaceae bacterium]
MPSISPIFIIAYLLLVISRPGDTWGGNSSGLQSDIVHLTLEQAVNLALKNNSNILSTSQNLKTGGVSLELAQSAFEYGFYPTSEAATGSEGENLNVGMGVKKKFSHGGAMDVTPSFGGDGSYYSGKIGLEITMPLFRGRGADVTLDELRGTEYQLAAIRLDVLSTRQDVVLETISTVYQIINGEKRVALYQDAIQRLKQEVVTAESKKQVGLAGPLDVYRAEIEVKEFEDNLVRERNNLLRSLDRLKTLLSLPLSTRVAVSAPLIAEELELDFQKALAIALEYRVDIKKSEIQQEEVDRKIRVAEHNLLPRADLNIRYENIPEFPFENQGGTRDEQWFFRLVGSTDIERKQERASLLLAQYEKQRVELDHKQLVDRVSTTIKNQLLQLVQSKQLLEIRRKQYEQTRGKRLVAGIKFRHGMADNADLIESEIELQRARVGILELESDYIIGTYRLRKELGTLLDDMNYDG